MTVVPCHDLCVVEAAMQRVRVTAARKRAIDDVELLPYCWQPNEQNNKNVHRVLLLSHGMVPSRTIVDYYIHLLLTGHGHPRPQTIPHFNLVVITQTQRQRCIGTADGPTPPKKVQVGQWQVLRHGVRVKHTT